MYLNSELIVIVFIIIIKTCFSINSNYYSNIDTWELIKKNNTNQNTYISEHNQIDITINMFLLFLNIKGSHFITMR